MKKVICLCCAFIFIFNLNISYAENKGVATSAKAVVLMEQSTKEVLFKNNENERLPIASVTKIMTMLLIMEAIDEGKISMEDMVSVSQRAMSMGGSTMFLEEGEELSVYEMLKGIAVASANDACVAMGEHIAGSEELFVEQMNNKAKELGMENTNFMNTNGLDTENHYSSALDVAKMSAELLKYEKIFEFTTIWTDTMHNGKFDLANTNKLIRFYQGANGLKTGSTNGALCCISATAKRNNMQLIAVVLGAPTSDDRFSDAKALLDYGFANYEVENLVYKNDTICSVEVKKGNAEVVELVSSEDFSYLSKKGNKATINEEILVSDYVNAPIKAGDKIGKIIYYADDKKICQIDLVAKSDVSKKSFGAYFLYIIKKFFS